MHIKSNKYLVCVLLKCKIILFYSFFILVLTFFYVKIQILQIKIIELNILINRFIVLIIFSSLTLNVTCLKYHLFFTNYKFSYYYINNIQLNLFELIFSFNYLTLDIIINALITYNPNSSDISVLWSFRRQGALFLF